MPSLIRRARRPFAQHLPTSPWRAFGASLLIAAVLSVSTAVSGGASVPAALASGRNAAKTVRTAGFEATDFGEFDAVSIQDGNLRISSGPPAAAEGSRFATASINGSGANAFARGQWSVDWRAGTVYRSEFRLLLPTGFYANQGGAIQVAGWDTFPTLDNHSRLAIWQSDRRARLYLKVDGVDTILTNSFAISEGRWVNVAIEQKLDQAAGWSRVYIDGSLVAQGSGRTVGPYPVTRMRYGLVAIDAARQTLPLSLHFDGVRLGRR